MIVIHGLTKCGAERIRVTRVPSPLRLRGIEEIPVRNMACYV